MPGLSRAGLTVKVGRAAAAEVELDSVAVELSSFSTFWASSAKAPLAKKAAAQATVAALNFIVRIVCRTTASGDSGVRQRNAGMGDAEVLGELLLSCCEVKYT